MENAHPTKALRIVVSAGFSGEVMEIARAAGAKGATIMNARGEGVMHRSIMGVTVDSEKEILLMLMDEETAERVMAAVKEKAGIHTPAKSICFTMPVERSTVINQFENETD